MSKNSNVDERIVSMKFDNKDFEKNTKETMSTLDRLKEKLNFKSAGEGLDNLSKSIGKVSFGSVEDGVDQVQMKFSLLDMTVMTVMQNIVNRCVDAGAQIAKSLTIEPVGEGFAEYELKMASVQTIMASTGADINTVNKYLEELNTYSDKTIYSFSDMTSSIGKFTNAGVSLDDAVMAIKGISNEAAVSGANANEASRAMYNFAQALSSGAVRLIDWKSIENANMATKEFKQLLIDTAVEFGTLSDAGDGMYETLSGKPLNAVYNFNDTLKDEWMTTDVLVETLKEYANETTDIGKKAFAAAQDVKTYHQLMDTLKEAVGSGWAQTFEIIFGDLEEAKVLWTNISVEIGGIIDRFSNARNRLLEGVLGDTSKITGTYRPIYDVILNFEKGATVTKDMWHNIEEVGYGTKRTKEYLVGVAEQMGVIERTGKETFKIGENNYNITDKWNESLKEGWLNVDHLDNSLNEINRTLTYNNRENREITESMWGDLEKLGMAGKDTKKTLIDTAVEMGKIEVAGKNLIKIGDKTYDTSKQWSESLKEGWVTLGDLNNALDQTEQSHIRITRAGKLIQYEWRKTGRELLLEGVANIWYGLKDAITAVSQAFHDVWPKKTTETLYALIDGFAALTARLQPTDAMLNAIRSSFRALFSVVDFFREIMKLAPKAISMALDFFIPAGDSAANFVSKIADLVSNFFEAIRVSDLFNTALALIGEALLPLGNVIRSVLEIAAGLITKFADMATVSGILQGIFAVLGGAILAVYSALEYVYDQASAFINKILELPQVQKIFTEFSKFVSKWKKTVTDSFGTVAASVKDFVKKVGGSQNLNDVIGSIKDGSTKESAKKLVKNLITAVKNIDPKEFGIELGNLIKKAGTMGIDAATNGILPMIKNSLGKIGDFFKGLIDSMIPAEFFTKALSIQSGISGFFSGILEAFDSFMNGVTKFSSFAGDVLSKVVTFVTDNLGAIVTLASGVAIVKTFSGVVNMMNGLGDALSGLGDAVKSFGKSAKTAITAGKRTATALLIKEFCQGLVMIAGAMVMLSFVSVPKLIKSGLAIGAMAVVIALIAKSFEKTQPEQLAKAAGAMIAFGVSMKLLSSSVAKLGKLDSDAFNQGMGAMALLFLFVEAVLNTCSKITASKDGDPKVIAAMLGAFAGSMIVLTLAVKMLGRMEIGSLVQGMVAIEILLVSMSLVLGKISKMNGMYFGAASAILSFAGSMVILATAVKMLGKMKTAQLIQGLGAIEIVLFSMVAVSRLMKSENLKGSLDSASLYISLGAALFLISLSIRQLSTLKPSALVKSIVAIEFILITLEGIVSTLGHSDKNAAKGGLALISLGAALLLISGSVMLLARIDGAGLAKATAAVGMMALFMGAALAIPRLVKNKKGTGENDWKTLIAVAAGAALLAVGIYLISEYADMGKIAAATACLTAIVGAVAGLMAVIAYTSKQKVSFKDIAQFAIISALVVAIGAVLVLITNLGDTRAAAELAVGLGAFAAGIAAMTFAVAKLPVATNILSKLKDILIMIGVMTAIAAVIGGLDTLTNGKVTEMMDRAVGIFAKIGELFGAIIGGAIAGAAKQLDFISGIGNSLKSFGTSAKEMSDSIATIPDGFADKFKMIMAAIVEMMGAGALSGLAGLLGGTDDLVTELTKMLPEITTMLSSFGDNIKNIDDNTLTRIQLAATAAGSLTEFAKGLPKKGGWVQKILGYSDLGEFSKSVMAFGGSLVSFAATISTLDENALKKIKTASKTAKPYVEMSKQVPRTGGSIDKLLGTKDLKTFGEKLVAFGQSMIVYATVVSNLTKPDIAKIKNSAKAGAALIEMSKQIPRTGGFIDKLAGSSDIKTFGEKLKAFGTGMKDYATEIEDLKEDDITKITLSAKAAKSLVGVAKKLEDGDTDIIELFGGKKDSLDDFGKSLTKFGWGLKNYSVAVKGLNVDDINKTIKPAKKLAEIAKLFDSTEDNSLVSLLSPDLTLSDFAKNLEDLGDGLNTYATKLTGIDFEAVNNSIAPVQNLAEIAPHIGDLLSGFQMITEANYNVETTFGALGSGMKSYCESLSGLSNFDGETANAVASSAATAVKEFVENKVSEADFGSISSDLTNLGLGLYNFSVMMAGADTTGADYVVSMSEAVAIMVETLGDADFTNLDKTMNFVTDLSKVGTEGITAFSTALSDGMEEIKKTAETLAGAVCSSIGKGLEDNSAKMKNGAIAFVRTGFTDATATIKSRASAVGKVLGGQVQTGIESYSSGVYNAGVTLANNLVNGVRSGYSDALDAGSYLVLGVQNGINTKAKDAVDAAIAMQKEVNKAIKDTAQEESPSKFTKEVGAFLAQGLALGIEHDAYKAVKSAKASTLDVMQAITDNVYDVPLDILDMQPTIRPVLDFSIVNDQVGYLDSLLGNKTISSVDVNFTNVQELQKLNKLDQLISIGQTLINATSQRGDVYLDGNIMLGYINRRLGMA